ncbi:tRNA (guanine(37)-N1)-methyltransferase-like [Liolophura sinensis]|uniref:tRNA (guanine(37)-N1)-methyltransferase-like n=1 Tax=Liolophura sinensis TaxID=3198878 RepID=UPI0031589BF7
MFASRQFAALSTFKLGKPVRFLGLPINGKPEKLKPLLPDPTCEPTTKITYRVSCLEHPKKNNFVETQLFWSWYHRKCRYFVALLRPIIHEKTFKKMNRVCRKEIDPPESVRGMTTLDKSRFKKTAKILGIRVPVKSMNVFSKKMKNTLLRIPQIRPIAEVAEDDIAKKDVKLALLDPEKYSSISDFKEEEKTQLQDMGIDLSSIKHYEIDLGYDNWNTSEILKAVLPTDYDNVSGFSTIGHIAHLNLKNELLDYKYFIGEVILDKIKTVSTVVNKLNTIDNTFRNFQMELLAGEENYVTVAKENGCNFEMDFSKVYWNSRLSTEHSRIVTLCPKDSVVYDVFAGVGPFTVPLMRKGCTVLANDLNPESFKWLNINIKQNKGKGHVTTYNMDGRDFIQNVVKTDLISRWKDSVKEEKATDFRVVMNLPAIAVEFLDAFLNIGCELSGECRASTFVTMPQVFCYCFTKSEDAQSDIGGRVKSVIGDDPDLNLDLFFVRNVAPNKDMYRISFLLPRTVVFRSEQIQTDQNSDSGPMTKKQKTR